MSQPSGVIDSHVHFWDPDRFDYAWLENDAALRRSFLPSDLDTGNVEVVGLVFVQADCAWDQAEKEVTWIEDLAAAGAPVEAVIAAVPIERGRSTADHVARLSHRPLVAGVRRLLQDEPPGRALEPDFVEGVRSLADHDLTFDLCIRVHQLREATELVARCPEVMFVLDHLAKPAVDPRGFTTWAQDMTRLAAHPNVRCKLSGLATEADGASRSRAGVAPYLDHALQAFGAERCLFGSDWPVSSTAVGYSAWADWVSVSLAGASVAEADAVWHGTARATYLQPRGTKVARC